MEAVAVADAESQDHYVNYSGPKMTEITGKKTTLFDEETTRTYAILELPKLEWPNLESPRGLDVVAKACKSGRYVSVHFNVEKRALRSRSTATSSVLVIKEARVETFNVSSVFRAVIARPTKEGGYSLFLHGKGNPSPFLAAPKDMFDSGSIPFKRQDAMTEFAANLMGADDFDRDGSTLTFDWGNAEVTQIDKSIPIPEGMFGMDKASEAFTSIITVRENEDKELPASLTDRCTRYELPAILFDPLPADGDIEDRLGTFFDNVSSLERNKDNELLARQLITQLARTNVPFYRNHKIVVPGSALAVSILAYIIRVYCTGKFWF